MMRSIKFLILILIIMIISACSTEENSFLSSNSTGEKNSEKSTGEVTNIENPNLDVDFSNSNLETIYFAGGCFWGVDAYFERVFGVSETKSGYANGIGTDPTYNSVMSGKEGFVETVRVNFDPDRVSVEELLDYLFRVIDPTVKDQQGNDVGVQYRTGIYYEEDSHKTIIENAVKKEQSKYDEEIVTEVLPIKNFYLAEDMHQDYLEKNPDGYCHINLEVLNEVKINSNIYQAPSLSEIKDQLTKEQFNVAIEDGTETAYENEYWDTYEPGIYVDIVTGEPLFSSNTKYDANCGWPSFTKPIDAESINVSKDNSANMDHTEVRSRVGDIHLGHVFDDGPEEEGGERYCINSASLKFIHVDDMKQEGYENLIHLVE